MKMNLDDPKLTAYALNELSGSDKSAMEAAIAGSPEAQARVGELRELSSLLKSEYAAERETQRAHDRNMIPFLEPGGLWKP